MDTVRSKEFPEQHVIAYKLLELIFEQNTLTTKKAYNLLGNIFELDESKMNETYDSGENIWGARVRAAKNNVLRVGGLITQHNNTKGVWEITDKGKEVLEQIISLGKIDLLRKLNNDTEEMN